MFQAGWNVERIETLQADNNNNMSGTPPSTNANAHRNKHEIQPVYGELAEQMGRPFKKTSISAIQRFYAERAKEDEFSIKLRQLAH